MKTILTIVAVWMACISCWGYDVMVDGLYYNLSAKKTAEVTSGETKYTGDFTIPETIVSGGVTYNVTAIGDSAFCGCYELAAVTFPKTLKTIGASAFADCSALSEVNFKAAVTIGKDAFRWCYAMAKVNIPNLKEWCKIVFGNPEANPIRYAHVLHVKGEMVHELEIPWQVKRINDYAFYRYYGLVDLRIKDHVRSIGKSAFAYCGNIQNLYIGDDVTDIAEDAFIGCENILLGAIGHSYQTGKSVIFVK